VSIAVIPPALSKLFEYLDGCQEPVDLARLEALLKSIHVTRKDLADYVQFNENTYRRNRVQLGQWYECLVLCWKPGMMPLGSPVIRMATRSARAAVSAARFGNTPG